MLSENVFCRERIIMLGTLLFALIALNSDISFSSPCPECFVLLYPDRDSSSGFTDYRCGNLSYDGHTGTDFAVADEAKMRSGVTVRAAAPGRVLRMRDGVPDRKVSDLNQVKGQECGNGLVIDHGRGWESQYCHLRQNSVTVRPGQQVDRGTPVGLVGQSGAASFPHVHFEVRHQGKTIDPNGGIPLNNSCSTNKTALWQQPIAYIPTALIHSGFSPQVPTMAEVEAGKWHNRQIKATDPSLIFWTRSYGVKAGDRVTMTMVNPDREQVVDYKNTLTKDNRIFFIYAGSRKVIPGTWTATFQLDRGNQKLIDISQTILVK